MPVPGPPCTTSTPDGVARMIRSCSAWIVATMSPIRPVRRAVTRGHQRRLAGQPGAAAGRGGVVEVEHLVVDGHDLAAPRAQVPAAAHALGRRGGGGVERLRRGRAPVHQQRLVLALLVEQAQPADVAPLPRLGVEPPERQAVLGRAQRREPVGVHRGGGVALGQGLRGADGLVVQDRLEPARGVGPALVEPVVEHGDVAPLVAEAVDVTATVVGGTVLRAAPGGPGASGAEHWRGAVGHRAVSPFEPGDDDCRRRRLPRDDDLRTYQRGCFRTGGRG